MLLLAGIGMGEVIVILLLALVLFGPKKLPEIGRSIGKGIREFKKGTTGLLDGLSADIDRPVTTPTRVVRKLEPAEKKPEVVETVIDLENKAGGREK